MHTPERAPNAGEGVCEASEAGVMKKRWSSREPGGLWVKAALWSQAHSRLHHIVGRGGPLG